MSSIQRRTFLKQTGAAATGLGLLRSPIFAAPGARSYGEEMPNMMLAHLARELNALAEKWDRERDNIKTPAQLEARNRFVREKMREMMHGFPEKTPLNPVIVATHQRQGYRVENVMFESRPNFWVTGNLYVPTSGKGPFPGIISPCGHYPWSRMEPEYQFAYMNMVLGGFVVLAFDPVGQGERRQYWNPQTGETEVASASTYEHSMPGQIQLLMGEDLTHYRVWDGMRAIDYLLTRPEVDKSKIGCAGHSGGGTLTRFIAAVDERVQCAVTNEGGTGHRWPMQVGRGGSIGPSDVEQNIFPAALYGIDGCDTVVAIAPRPCLTTIEHYNPAFNAAVEHIRKRYELLGVPEKFEAEEATDPHSWTVKLRIATTDWFSRWFYGKRGPTVEPKFQAETMETLYCTPDGSIRYSQTGETVFSLMLKKQEHLPPPRKMPANTAGVGGYCGEMVDEITKMLRYRKSDTPLDVRHLYTTQRKGYQVEKLEFISEPGIYIPTWVFIPEKINGPQTATLYVHEAGKEADGQEFGLLEELALKGRLVIAVDIRGIGATRPGSPDARGGGFGHLFNTETAMAYIAWYMNEELLGTRVLDVVRTVDYALSRPDVRKDGVRLVGRRAGATWALYAAALDPRITEVVAERGMLSYRSLAQVDRYLHGAHLFVRDVLLHFDLPQVAAAIADRKLTLVSPVDPMMNAAERVTVEREYEWTAAIYNKAGARDRFRIAGGSLNADNL